MNKSLYPRLAIQNLKKNARFYTPYILTVIGAVAAFYIMCSLSFEGSLPERARYSYLQTYVGIGTIIIGLFSVIFLFYTNSFLMKQRKRELGLYNVLGMGKRHIAAVLAWETLYTSLIGISFGILVGMLFRGAVTALALRLMRFEIYYGSALSLPALLITAVFFGGLLVCCLLSNILRQSRLKPVEMMREGSAGEREPRTRWLLTILGVLSLGGGYAIAITVKSATEALALYFVAVFLVIIGTYCLFTAVSIAVLKLLRRNKKFYYRTGNFIGVSGMLYRMKRNAVGLANICILSTMVLVMVSGTLSLFLGTEDILDAQYPSDVNITLNYDPNSDNVLRKDDFLAEVKKIFAQNGIGIDGEITQREYLDTSGWATDNGIVIGYCEDENAVRTGIRVISAAEYTSLTGMEVTPPAHGEALIYSDDFSIDGDVLSVIGITGGEGGPSVSGQLEYRIVGRINDNNNASGVQLRIRASCIIILSDADEVYRFAALDAEALSGSYHTKWKVFINTDGDEDGIIALGENLDEMFSVIGADVGGWEYYMVETRAQNARDFYENNGGFFFLGIFLGLLFMMAAALIIYYKQITEGFEDCERYRIMRQVGLDRREIRRSVNTQVLIVFFAPLLVAACHVAFDFPLVKLLLTLFGLENTALTLLCTLGTFVGFALIYGVLFMLTARVYNRIVN